MSIPTNEIEARLRAIETLVREAQEGSRPMYMVAKAFEAIGREVSDLRDLLTSPFDDLNAFYRVSDILASRMGTEHASRFIGSEIEKHVRTAVQASMAEGRRDQKLTEAVGAFLVGGPIAPVAELLQLTEVPTYRYGLAGGRIVGSQSYAPYPAPYAQHALQLRLARIVEGRDLDKVLTAYARHVSVGYASFPEPGPDSPVWDPRWSMGEVPTSLSVSVDTVHLGSIDGKATRGELFAAFFAGTKHAQGMVRPKFSDKLASWTALVWPDFNALSVGVMVPQMAADVHDPAPVPVSMEAAHEVEYDEDDPLWDPSWPPGGEPDELVVTYKGKAGEIEETYPGSMTRAEFMRWFRDYPREPDHSAWTAPDGWQHDASWGFILRPKFAGKFVGRSTGMGVKETEGRFILHVLPVV